MTATRPQSLSDTAMAPKITEAANMSTGTVHIHNRSTNMPKRSGCTGGLVARSGLVPCSILLLQNQTPPVRGTEGIRGSTHLCRLRRPHLAANGCLRGRLLAFNGRLAGGARCARRPAARRDRLPLCLSCIRCLARTSPLHATYRWYLRHATSRRTFERGWVAQ